MLEKSLINTRLLKAAVIVLGFIFVLPAPGWAQAILGVSGTPTTAVRTGYTELLGSIQISVNSGTTIAATLQVSISPATIAVPTSGITVTGTGGLTGAALVAVAPDAGILTITIPAGATTGGLTISGIRTSIPALNNATTVDARVSLTGNFLVAGQNVQRILEGVTDALVIDPATDASFTLAGGGLVDTLGPFTFSEGAPNALSSDVGTLGQTQPAQVVFQLIGLPDGVAVGFPAVIIGSSGATLTALSTEDITNQAAPPRKIYVFADSASGPTTIDTFSVTPTLSLSGGGSGTAFLQVAEGPLAITPTSIANIIPRYVPTFVPAAAGSPVTTRILDFPISSTNTKVVVANVSTGAAFLTVRARQDDGAVIPGADFVTFTLLSKQTVSLVPATLFAGVSLNTLRTLEVESQSTRVVASALDPSGYFRPLLDEGATFYLPFDRRNTADVPVLTLNNGAQAADVTITLRTATGQIAGSTVRTLLPNGALRGGLAGLLNVDSGAFGLTGYVVVSAVPAAPAASDAPSPRIRVSLINHPDGTAESVFGVATIGQTSVPIPFFAFGGAYSSTLSLINGSATAKARVTLTPRQPSGAPLAGTTAVFREINPGERLDLNLGQTFGTNLTATTVGYLVLAIDAINPGNPFSGPPPVAGLLHISSGNPTTAFPVAANAAAELFLTPTIDGVDDYTGLAILNAGTAAASVTVELTSPDGASRGSTTFSLAAGVMRSQLLRELFPNSVPHQDGTVRITSSLPVNVVGFRGSLTLANLAYIHAQTAPQ